MPVRPVTEFLEQNRISYHCYNHPPAATAQEIAQKAHIPGHQLAKTVILKADGRFVMAVLPADEKVDKEKLRKAMGVDNLEMAREQEFSGLFPWCEPGGEPPLGVMYGMDVYMERDLVKEDVIAFNAGTHTEVLKMDTATYRDLIKPHVCTFAMRH